MWIDADGLVAVETILDEMMVEEAFFDRLKEIYNDLYLTDRYLGGDEATNLLDRDDYPGARWYDDEQNDGRRGLLRTRTNTAVAREPLELIVHVVRSQRPFTEIVTADYMVVNAYSARSFGVTEGAYPDGGDPDAFDAGVFYEAKAGDIPHAGVLTSPVYLNRFPTTPTNVNRHRSRMAYSFFLGTDVMKLAERPVDPTSIEDFNPTLYNPNCAVCHAVMDPLAGAFQNWDGRGRYRPPEGGWHQDMRPPGLGKAVIPHEDRYTSLQWLGRQIAADPRFATATVHTIYTALTGRPIHAAPATVATDADRAQLAAFDAQAAEFAEVAKRFVAESFDLRSVVKGIVVSPLYRAIEADEAGASFGTGRLLTPEQLDRKITAALGVSWRRNSRPVLLSDNEFRIFYGGIDSDAVTKRITQPNGIMASIATRMAVEMACSSVARDFVLPASARSLFSKTELAFVPRDDNGFEIPAAVDSIRATIQHLHQRILGERLAPEAPEIERTYQLFLETWLEGTVGMDRGLYSAGLRGACQASRDPRTDERLPESERITSDPHYTVRAWMAVLTYLLSDWDFLYE